MTELLSLVLNSCYNINKLNSSFKWNYMVINFRAIAIAFERSEDTMATVFGFVIHVDPQTRYLTIIIIIQTCCFFVVTL